MKTRLPLIILPLVILLSAGFPHMDLQAQTFTDSAHLLNTQFDGTFLTGASAVDFNNDGLVDIYRPGQLFLNKGTEGFVDILFQTGVIEGDGVFGAAFADYNGDGYPDIVFEDFSAPGRVYRNDRDLTFTQVNSESELIISGLAQGAGWSDYNLDGRLDLYVNNDQGDNQLFENLGNGLFMDISQSAGMPQQGNSYGMAWGDYNNDGYPDIFNATCSGLPQNSIKHLLRNNGDGTFDNVNVQAGVADSLSSWCVNWFDFDNDGDLDVYIGNIQHQPRSGRNRLYSNNGDGTFADMSLAAGVAGEDNEDTFGASIADFDNDGWQDIYVANSGFSHRLYHNNGDRTFTDVAQSAGIDEIFHSSVAVADFNSDGWIDVFTPGSPSNLWYNDGGSNHWLRVQLRQPGENYHGISARVEVVNGQSRQMREVQAGDGFCAQNHALSVHFGLGSASVVDSVIVKWPGGESQSISNVTVDRVMTIVRGVGINGPPGTFHLTSPGDGSLIGEPVENMTFSWENSEDPENDNLTYTLILSGPESELSLNAGGQSSISVEPGMLEGVCSWTVQVGDGHSNVASSDVFYFRDAKCKSEQVFALSDVDSQLPGSTRSVAWTDFDADGFQDLFLSRTGTNGLYRNEQGAGLTSTNLGDLVLDNGSWRNSTWADFDNDGDIDVFVVNASGENRLYRRTAGGFQFEPNTGISADQLISTACSWLDFDNDNDVDLIVGNIDDDTPIQLFKNLGNGTFEPVTTGDVIGNGSIIYSVAPADYDNDSFTDIYITDQNQSGLFHNNGQGVFTRVVDGDIGILNSEGRTASWGDMDNDGDLDLFVGRSAQYAHLLFQNNGGGTFTALNPANLVSNGNSAVASGWADVNNDGLLDIFVGFPGYSLVYINLGGGMFEDLLFDVTRSRNADFAAWVDFDRDGDMDLISGRAGGIDLFTNLGAGNQWVGVVCSGTVSNRAALGARVRVLATIDGEPVSQIREITGQSGHYSQSSQHANFGVGDAIRIDSLVVKWPSGHVDRFANLLPNRYFGVTEASGITSVSDEDGGPREFSLHQNYPNPFNPETTISYFLPERAKVRIEIFNSLGRLVRILVDEEQSPGARQVAWDGKSDPGAMMPSGVYFFKLSADDRIQTRRMVLLK